MRAPGNRFSELASKFAFYERFGVEEYYLLNPDPIGLEGWRRENDRLIEIRELNGWISPRTEVRFELSESDLRIFAPSGRPFETYVEMSYRIDSESQLSVEAYRAEEARLHANEARLRANAAQLRADRLADKLRTLGIDPDA